MADHGGEELRPATREELVESLSFAMRFQGCRRVHNADSLMARIAAERPPLPAISDAAHRRAGPPLKD
jgi:hypothetical protein